MMILRLLVAALAVVLFAPTAAHAAYAPQGGKWAADGSGPTYHQGMAQSQPTTIAIGQYQRLLGIPVTKRYDAATTAAVLRHQRARKWLRNTGKINFPTSRSILAPLIEREARRAGISPRLLCGHLWAESRIDPGAVGKGGTDNGVAQIVPRYKPPESGWDVVSSVRRMATDDARAIRSYGGWGPVAWWKPVQAKTAAAGHASPEAHAYMRRIAAAPCGGFAA